MNKEYNISVFDQVDIVYLLFFVVSFFSSAVCSIFYLVLFFYCRYGTEKCVKALLLITTRGILNSALVSGTGNAMVKFFSLLGISILILLNSNKEDSRNYPLDRVTITLVLFAIYAIVASFFSGTYPITSLLKVVSFIIPFLAILYGVFMTRDYCRWADYVAIVYTLLMIVSFITIPIARFRTTNDNFQGVFNQVNMFGIIAAIYIAILLCSNIFKRRLMIRTGLIIMVLLMIFLSASRTGMFSSLTVLFIYFFFGREKNENSTFFTIVGVFVVILAILLVKNGMYDGLQSAIQEFVFKGSTTSIFESRLTQVEVAQSKFANNHWLGSGFMVPLNQNGEISYGINFSLIVEPGNLIWCLLGDTGIIGTTIFMILFVQILISGKIDKLYLLVASFMINMGEMVFFSSNNMSILCYFLLALYMFDNMEEYYDENEYNSAGI